MKKENAPVSMDVFSPDELQLMGMETDDLLVLFGKHQQAYQAAAQQLQIVNKELNRRAIARAKQKEGKQSEILMQRMGQGNVIPTGPIIPGAAGVAPVLPNLSKKKSKKG